MISLVAFWISFSACVSIEEVASSKTKILGCPIVREGDGLAMSSRNSLLNIEERKLAVKLFEGLQFAKHNAKKVSYGTLKDMVAALFDKYDELALDYFKIADPKTLKEISFDEPIPKGRGFIAAHLGKIRLIDNTHFNSCNFYNRVCGCISNGNNCLLSEASAIPLYVPTCLLMC